MRMPSAVRPCRRTAWQRGASVLRVIIRSTAALLIFGAVPLAHAAGPAAATAGTNIGNAAQLTTSATGTITSGSDDWWVIYPQTPGEKVTVTIQNNGSPSCAIEAKLDSTNGADENLVAAEIQPGASGQLQRSAFGSDRYYVEVEPFDCSSSAPYKITLNAGGGGTPPDPAHGTIAAGTSIGDAWPPLQGHTTYPAMLANQDSGDWYVLYKKPGTALASIRVQDATVDGPGSCAIAVTLYNTDGADGPISGHDIQVNGSATFSVPGSEIIDPQGRYFLQVQGFDCGAGGADYTIEPESAAQWGSPARAKASRVTAGLSIGGAWPPLQGAISYHHTLATPDSEDWYVLYKKPDTSLASIRVQDATVDGPGSCAIAVTLYNTDGADGPISGNDIQVNGSATFSVPGSEIIDPQGRYFLQVQGFDCGTGGADYTIEPESAAQWGSPARAKASRVTAGLSIGGAWPPLQGAISYHHTLATPDSEDWYVLYKKPDTSLASIRVQDATVDGPGSCAIAVTLYNTDGANGPISGHDIQVNGSATFSVPGSETIDPQGRYFLQVQGFDCGTGGADYTIETEPAAQWASPARPASRLLPGGPRKAAAGGPLVGSVHYRGSLVTATSRQWTYFQVNGLTPVTVHVEDTTLGGDSCEAITVTLQNAKGSTVDAAQLGDNGASSMRVARAGTYLLRLTVAEECSPSAPVNAIVFLAPARGLRGPVLKVSDLTLPQGVAHRAYRAPIKIAGRVTRRAFTAETALPPGLRLNSKTGVITGKPTIAGKYTFLVKIPDSAKPHHSVTDLFQLTIS